MSGLTYEQVMGGGMDAGTVRVPHPGQGASPPRGGAMGYTDLRALAQFAGADPSVAGIMARMALAESSGNPTSNADHKTSYVENGKTYYPEGLWQISTVHGTGGGAMFGALANARQAVKLFQDQGFGPWEASRHGGAGGGWGQYLESEMGLPPTAHYAQPRHGMGGGANDEFYAGMVADSGLTADQVMSGASPAPTGGGLTADQVMAGGASPSPDPSGGLTADQVMAGQGAAPRTAGIGQIPGRVVKDVKALVSHQPIEAHSPVGHAVETLRANWDWMTRHPWESFFNVLGTSSRMGMSVATDLAAHKDIGAIAKDLWHSVWDADEHEVSKLTAGMEHIGHNSPLNLPEHEGIDAWVKTHVPKNVQGQVGMILKGAEDFGAQASVDPLTYSGFGDIVKGAEMLKLIHPMFAGGQLALWGWKAAKAAGMGEYFEHLRTLSGTYDTIIREIGRGKDFFTVRPDLNMLSPETKKIRMQIEGRVEQGLDANRESNAAALKGATDEQAKRIFLQHYLEHGSPANAAAARRMLAIKAGTPKITPTNTLKEANLKDALTEFVEKADPNELPDVTLERRLQKLSEMRGEIIKGQSRSETEAYIQKFGTADDKKIDVSKLSTGSREASTLAKGLENFPMLRVLRNWERQTIKYNPLPHAVKNVGTLTYLTGGARAIVDGLIRGAGDVAKTTYANDVAAFGRYAGKTMRERLTGMAAASPDYAYGVEKGVAGTLRSTSSQAMVRIEDGWRQAILEMLDRKKPTRWGTEFEDKDELLKGAIINDRLGDYRNQAAFVRLFEGLGGPFVAFRMGIVPRNVVMALKENPERVMAIIRAQYDLNVNRKGHRANELEIGGPVGDFAKNVFNLPSYIQTTLGMPDFLQQYQGVGDPWSEVALRTAQQYIPGASIASEAAQVATGTAMPGPGPHHHQPMTLPDQIAVSVLMALGMYFKEKPLRQTERARVTQIHKQGG